MLSVAIALELPAKAATVVAVTQSCEEAIGEGRCPAASELRPAAVVAWYARVIAEDPDASELKIEFHDRDAFGTVIETRVLAFSERDEPKNRWATVGAVIAAFVAARDGTEAPQMRARPRPLPPIVAPAAPRESPAWNIDLAAFAGPGLERGGYRFGALGRGYVGVPGVPGGLGLVSLRYAERPGEPTLSWWSASCGVGARVGGHASPLGVELTGELVFERLHVSATDPLTSTTNDAAQDRFGGRLSTNFALQLVDHLAWVVGAEATALRPSLAITVGAEDRGRAPAVSFAFSTGVRFSGGG